MAKQALPFSCVPRLQILTDNGMGCFNVDVLHVIDGIAPAILWLLMPAEDAHEETRVETIVYVFFAIFFQDVDSDR